MPMAHLLFVIAPEVFRDEEYAVPREVLEGYGATITTASTRPGLCSGKLGMTAEATLSIADADPAAYDAVVFIGGGGAAVYFDDPAAHKLARGAFDAGRIVAAICIAPSIIAHAWLLRGVKATAFPSQEDDLHAHGALWSGAPVQVDLPFITANGPEAAHEFAREIARALGLA
jgi:protease I